MRTRICSTLIAVAMMAVGGLPNAQGAQQATPAADLGPPTAAECQIAPRSEAEIAALAATPIVTPATPVTAEPATLPAGEPADAATIAGLMQTLRDVIACAEAGDLGRLLALYTDEYIAREILAAEPVPIVPGHRPAGTPQPPSPPAVIDLTPVILEARLLPDGRVAALVTIAEPGSPVDVVWFQRVGDRWLIDMIRPAELRPGTPSASPLPEDLANSALIQAILADAASQLGVGPDQVIIVAIEPVDWPDTSLGCPKEGEFYAQVITPGYRVIVARGDRRLEYHTDRAANFVLCESPS
ncbi:MAG: hypothetical protein C4346_13460 [Chloroflexota bacterium]